MKKLFFLLALFVVVISIGCSKKEENINREATGVEEVAGEYKKISPEEAKEMMDDSVIILDVRTEEEFAQGYISGAVLIPDYEIEQRAGEELMDKNQKILVYCRSGRRSEAASRILLDMGYVNVYDFGGIIDWPYDIVNK